MATSDFELFLVSEVDGILCAKLEFSFELESCSDYHGRVERDFTRLAGLGTLPIELDLTTVQHVSDIFIGLLLKLAAALKKSDRRFTMLASPYLGDQFQLLHLTRIFNVSDFKD